MQQNNVFQNVPKTVKHAVAQLYAPNVLMGSPLSVEHVFCAAVDVPNVPQLQAVQLVSQDTSLTMVLVLFVLPTVKLVPMETPA